MDKSRNELENGLIVGITSYFLEKGNFWFAENLKEILDAAKTQSFFKDNILYFQKNQKFNLSEFLRKLDEMGYEKVYDVRMPGEFSHRGGVIETFPVNGSRALRVDFLGNRIESIEEFGTEIEDEKKSKEILKKRLKSQKLFSDLGGLKPLDYIVHLDHGIAVFAGLNEQGYYVLEYAKGDKLYLPKGLERKLSRYVGFSEPAISRLSSPLWQKTKKKIREDAEEFAKELLKIYSERHASSRPPYSEESELESYISSTFPYEETPDQRETIEDIGRDLKKTKPMDRLVLGDVGFGKTEVALRAALKAVQSGYQAAFLCPTTILAYQHFKTFSERLKNLPIKVALLSRLTSKKQQGEIKKEIEAGRADIIIGTHRILSKDISSSIFARKEAGLLIIDDEQRFGVGQKERLKKIRPGIDVLSLSATPIPRTLYMSLSSLKDISLIHTSPAGRMPVKTTIAPYSEDIVRKAIEAEIKRGGRVYYLHNRVETIEAARKNLQKICPDVRFGAAFGRMKEKELIKIMDDFQSGKIDVLLATTIIENGLDIPKVNTLLVADAARLGLAQAYQIRGRVGRSFAQGFAYFLHSSRLSEKAEARLETLKEAEALGSGYKIALKDLEIRGAGNILGREQSGKINRVGLNLYCQMVSEAVERLKKA